MRKLFFWSIMGPIGVIIVLFAVSNREMMTLSLWPLPFEVTAPTFIPALGGIAIGFLMGAVMVWFQGGKQRKRARQAENARDLTARENVRLKQQAQSTANVGTASGPQLPATTHAGAKTASSPETGITA